MRAHTGYARLSAVLGVALLGGAIYVVFNAFRNLSIADIKALPDYASNVAKNPMAAMMYGTSVLTCMSSALSEPGGLGLGIGARQRLHRLFQVVGAAATDLCWIQASQRPSHILRLTPSSRPRGR